MNRFTPPPRRLRKARLDNIAIVPASLLPQKARYQALATELPRSDVLIVLPDSDGRERQLAEATAQLFRATGHGVVQVCSQQLDEHGQAHL